MIGFEVRIKDKIIYAAIDDEGVLPVMFYHLNESVVPENIGTHLSISGLDSFEHLRWFSGSIDDVKRVVIKVVEVEQVSEYHTFRQNKEELIQSYHSLKKELQEEGLL